MSVLYIAVITGRSAPIQEMPPPPPAQDAPQFVAAELPPRLGWMGCTPWCLTISSMGTNPYQPVVVERDELIGFGCEAVCPLGSPERLAVLLYHQRRLPAGGYASDLPVPVKLAQVLRYGSRLGLYHKSWVPKSLGNAWVE